MRRAFRGGLIRLLLSAGLALLAAGTPPALGQPAQNAGAAPADPTAGGEQSIRNLARRRDALIEERVALAAIAQFREEMLRRVNELGRSGNPLVDSLLGQIRDEQTRLSQLEAMLRRAAGDDPAAVTQRRAALEAFDRNFPLRPNLTRGGAGDPALVFNQLRGALRELQTKHGAQFAEMFTRFEDSLSDVEQSFGNPQLAIARLRSLPNWFYELSAAASFEELATNDELRRGAIERYRREFLEKVLEDLNKSGQTERDAIAGFRNSLEEVGRKLTERQALNQQALTSHENETITQARLVFGKSITESSFYALLAVFAFVFLCLLGLPVLYRRFDSEIARGILKPEFLLQIATVFVLTSAILILGIGGFIAQDQLPVLLAGISGYVLGQLGPSALRTGEGGQRNPSHPA